MKQLTLSIIILFILNTAFSQCTIKSHLGADDVMYYFIDPVKFYWTSAKELNGGVMTDEQNYFLGLMPKPFPPKSKDNKLKEDVLVTLSNNKEYKLAHYDTVYPGDSALLLIYIIPQKELEDFKKFEIEKVKIEMGEGYAGGFNFKLHKTAVKEQLDCLTEKLKKK